MAMMRGETIANITEKRSVLHYALRMPKGKPVIVNGEDVVLHVHDVLDRIQSFSESVRCGAWRGCTGKAITTVVSIGIGGSYLGPEFVYEALRFDKVGILSLITLALPIPHALYGRIFRMPMLPLLVDRCGFWRMWIL